MESLTSCCCAFSILTSFIHLRRSKPSFPPHQCAGLSSDTGKRKPRERGRDGQARPGEGRGRGAGPEDYSAQEGKERKEEERDSSRGEVVSAGFALVGSKHRKVSLVCFSSVRFGLVCSVADEQVWFFQGICSECSVIASRPPFRRQKVSQFWVGRERERERESAFDWALRRL